MVTTHFTKFFLLYRWKYVLFGGIWFNLVSLDGSKANIPFQKFVDMTIALHSGTVL